MHPDAEPPPVSTLVEHSHPCRRCGYELRGLPVRGVCPECGGLVARSLQGNLLAFADPAFLRWIAFGAVLVVCAIVLICAVPIIATLLRALAGWTSDIIDGPNAPLYRGAASLATLAAGGLALVGWFALTARDPNFIGADASTRARLMTRMSTALIALLFALGAALMLLPLLITTAPFFFWRLSTALPPVLVACIGVQVASSQSYLSHLAIRIPDRTLRGDASMVRRVTLFTTVLMEAGIIFSSLRRTWPPLRSLVVRLDAVGTIIGVVYFVLVLGCCITVLVRYADVLDRVRRHALRIARLSSVATTPDEDREIILTALAADPEENTLRS